MSVTARGGYQIVDFHDIVVNEAGAPTVIPGIGEQIKNYASKPVCISGLVIHAASMSPGYNVAVPPQYVDITAVNDGELLSFKVTADGDVYLSIQIIVLQDAVMVHEISD